MSDDEVTDKSKVKADGTDCPAAQPLCACGVRGCPDAAVHARLATRKPFWKWARR
jgi:hypothetical protein